jgi:putative spermidine/putrescine transport system substrate-binding protein
MILQMSTLAHGQGTLRVTTFGGSYGDHVRKALIEPFERETGIKVIEDSWDLKISKIRAMVEAKNITSDVFVGDPWDAVSGCDEGILEPIDPQFLGDMTDFPAHAIVKCGVSSHIWASVFSWNADKITGEKVPKTAADMFDLKKFPGKRAMSARVYVTTEYALVADGVPTNRLYEVLRSPGGFDRALAKLDTIRDDVIWWTSSQKAVQLLIDGEVTYAVIPTNRWFNAVWHEKKNLGALWRTFVFSYDTWFMPRGTPNKANAVKFLEFLMRAQKQADLTNLVSVAPSRKSAMQYVRADIRPLLPTSHFEGNSPISLDTAYWADNLDSNSKRFQAWLQKK